MRKHHTLETGRQRVKMRLALTVLVGCCLALLLSPLALARTYSSEELAFLTLINEYRQQNGVRTLLLSDMISLACVRHNADMATYGRNTPSAHITLQSDYFPVGSQPWDRMALCGYDYNTYMAENLAFGAPTAQVAFDAWCASPIHQPYMISSNYKVIGISLLEVPGSEYVYYWTTDFGGYVDPTAHDPFTTGSTTTTTATTTSTTVPPTTSTSTTTTTVSTTTSTPTTSTTTGQTTTTTLGSAPFVDVPLNDAYYEAVYGLWQRGVVQGYAESRQFGRGLDVRRAQLAKMACLALGVHVGEELICPFTDVGTDSATDLYPHDFIAAAAAAGITLGVGNGEFAPWSPISRAQVVTMIVRGARSYAPDVLLTPPSGFRGVVPASGDAAHDAAMKVAERSGLLTGVEGLGANWNPWSAATRGEVAQILWNVVQ